LQPGVTRARTHGTAATAPSDCFRSRYRRTSCLGQPVELRLRRAADDAQVAIADLVRPAALNRSRGIDQKTHPLEMAHRHSANARSGSGAAVGVAVSHFRCRFESGCRVWIAKGPMQGFWARAVVGFMFLVAVLFHLTMDQPQRLSRLRQMPRFTDRLQHPPAPQTDQPR